MNNARDGTDARRMAGGFYQPDCDKCDDYRRFTASNDVSL